MTRAVARNQGVDAIEEVADDPSTVALAMRAGVTSFRSPARVPVASGRFGVRSPSKWGTSTMPRAQGSGQRQGIELLEADP